MTDSDPICLECGRYLAQGHKLGCVGDRVISDGTADWYKDLFECPKNNKKKLMPVDNCGECKYLKNAFWENSKISVFICGHPNTVMEENWSIMSDVTIGISVWCPLEND